MTGVAMHGTPTYLPKARTEAFSDAVIAIIVTILVLEVKVPRLEGPDLEAGLHHAMLHALPVVAAYVLSFLVLLVFWVAHHHLLHSMRRVDRNFLWLNGVFLMLLAFVPVPTELMGEYPSAALGSVLYGAALAAAGLAFVALRGYATRHGSLLHEAIPADTAREAVRKGLLSPVLYGAGALAALVDPRIAWALYVLVPLIYMWPGRFDRAAHALRE
ncbi:MAG: TMEM175 family protein [Lautropia sp.]